jgi:8-oxo-dGTP pyrophosphatase MutT (NUDIX family)
MSWTGGFEPGRSGTEPVPAATVIPLRDGDGLEVLLLRRSKGGAFGGMWVFPGGKVDPEDAEAAAGEDEISMARAAAVREAREEAAIELDPASLVLLSFWLPPPEAPRRFATWFFLAPFAAGPEVVVDLGEIREHRWLSPVEAIRQRDVGEMELAPPTFTTLWWLSRHTDSESAIRAAERAEPQRYETHVALTPEGHLATLWAGDAGYEDGDLERPGPRRRLWMVPDGWRVEESA